MPCRSVAGVSERPDHRAGNYAVGAGERSDRDRCGKRQRAPGRARASGTLSSRSGDVGGLFESSASPPRTQRAHLAEFARTNLVIAARGFRRELDEGADAVTEVVYVNRSRRVVAGWVESSCMPALDSASRALFASAASLMSCSPLMPRGGFPQAEQTCSSRSAPRALPRCAARSSKIVVAASASLPSRAPKRPCAPGR